MTPAFLMAGDDAHEGTPTLRRVNSMMGAYARLFAASPAAPLLSRSKPVRRSGFDRDLVVSAVTVEADDVVSLTLTARDLAPLPRWVPGAHLDVFLPSGRQRQYSLCGDPADRSRYRIAVRRLADGNGGSLEMHELTEGDALSVRGPRNAFTFIEADSYLFVAGGIGITPILPMVRAAAARGARWRLVYLGRSRSTLPFLEELAAIGGGTVDVRTDDVAGLPDPAEVFGLARPGDAVYLCGPVPLQDAARRILPAVNPTGSLHAERFSPLPVVGGEPFELRLARSGVTVQVAADQSALAAVRAELPGVKYSCQQGFCGSCKVRVLAGEVEHRDTKLLDGERDDSMLICVSRAAGNHLVLDL